MDPHGVGSGNVLVSTGSGYRQMAGSCEWDNKPSVSMNCGEFLYQLRTDYLLKKYCVPWSYYTFKWTLKPSIYLTRNNSAFGLPFFHSLHHLLYQLHVAPISLSTGEQCVDNKNLFPLVHTMKVEWSVSFSVYVASNVDSANRGDRRVYK
jgi:hypothetical protein